MKTKEIYSKPQIEIVKIEMESVIACSLEVSETEVTGPARSKRSFWGDDEELSESICTRRFGGRSESQELGLPVTASGLALPCGATCRWER